MKRFLILFVILGFQSLVFCQKTDPEKTVQASLDAYNNHDFEKFMSYFSENVEMYEIHNCTATAKGVEEVRKRYKDYFEASPNLHSKILNRIVFGNTVIDYEYITGARGSKEPYELIFMYEVENGKIIRTTAIRK